ncbi:MAG: hypothetical protein ACJ0F8_00100 [Gammaproteobacteria bacterium]|uniref:Lycopene cyclase domain-containing protein n=1 Tax=SAR86 cluster bacterium TaxID=2030880 RepID=A0A520MXJ1_9GAMM|nr:MAG: hypothetical protein EVA92_04260 [SAR86 cluster bacterium]|tara:strand:- start:167 stop:760 length:594 start_codon:yes stop_codon:yes gene_type:complete
MTVEEIRIVFVVYVSAILPLMLILFLRNKIPSWIPKFYFIIFLICAFGWELWFNFGILNGDSVNLRRSESLNFWLPQNINWILNSMADAGTISIGGLLLMWLFSKKNTEIFRQWSWGSFLILSIWCIGQNLFVEMFLYHDQLSLGKQLSWAPLSPLGQIYNPILFEFQNRTVMLQTQLPWVFTPFLIYYFSIKFNKK